MIQFITEVPDQGSNVSALPAPNGKLLASLQSSRGHGRFNSTRRYQGRTKLPSIRGVSQNEPVMPLSRIEREAQALSLGHGSASKDREIDAMLS